MRSWGAAGLAVAIVFGAGCSGGSTAADPPASAATVSSTTATPKSTARVTTTTKRTTPPPPYSFDNSVPPPELVLRGKDHVRVLTTILAYSAWLSAHRPAADLAARVSASGSRALEIATKNMAELRDNDVRGYEVKTGPDEITIVSSSPSSFTARVVQHITFQRVVNRSGRVTSERPLDGSVSYVALVVRQGDEWRLAALDEQPS